MRSTFFGNKFTNETLRGKPMVWNYAENKYGIKISDALKILCEPLVEKLIPAHLPEDVELSLRQTIYTLGMTVWNCCVATGNMELALAMVNGFAIAAVENGNSTMSDQEMQERFFPDLIERKFKLYPHIDAIILSFELSYCENNWNLRVHSQF